MLQVSAPHSEAPAASKGKAKGPKGPGKGPPVTRRSFVGVRGFLVLFLLCGGVGMSLSSCCLQLGFRMRKESSRCGFASLSKACESETAQAKGKGAPPPQTADEPSTKQKAAASLIQAAKDGSLEKSLQDFQQRASVSEAGPGKRV